MLKRMAISVSIIILLASFVMPVYAAQDTEEQKGQLVWETITIGDETITIPTAIKRTNNTVMTRNSIQAACEEAVTYYIPVTEEGREYNNNLRYASRSLGEATDTFPDPKHYMVATSHIRYTISSGTLDVYLPDLFVRIDNVAITKDKEPESSSSGGILWGIGNPTADKITCVGARPNGSQYIPGTMNQEVYNVAMTWGTGGVNTPSSWVPVISGQYSSYYRGLVQYSYRLVYNTGEVNCSFTHTLAK